MPITLTDKAWQLVERVNYEVNALPYKTDMELYGRPEFWTIMGDAGGDCDDYALTKRRRLWDAGLDPLYLCPATGSTAAGIRHAVLLVESDLGTYVMDNIQPLVLAWDDPRVSIKQWRDRAHPSGKWVSLRSDV